MIETLPLVLGGVLLGVIAGLVPGVHANTIALLAVAFAARGDIGCALMVVSMSVTQTVVDFVPSILLGAPESGTELSILPGHRMLLHGKGFFAVQLAITGCLVGGTIAILLSPVFVLFLQKGADFISAAIPFALGAVLLMMLFGENGLRKKFWAFAVVSMSGLLGAMVLRGNIPVQDSLFCLTTGFFGASTLISSIGEKQALPEQRTGGFRIGNFRAGKYGFVSFLGGALVAVVPSISPSEAAFVIRKIAGKIKTRDYLVLLGGTNTANMILSFFTMFALGKTRTGSAAAIKQLIPVGTEELWLIAAACLIGLGAGAIAADLSARIAVKNIHLADYKKINIAVLVFICLIVLAFSGLLGALVFVSAAGIGLISVCTGTRRTNCMAFLMIPTLLFYLGF